MLSAKASDFSLLLQVFRDGLEYGVISKKQIIAWVDYMLMETGTQDGFFIELSKTWPNGNLLGFLKQNVGYTDNPIRARVLLGLAWQQVADETMDIERLDKLLNDVEWMDVLTQLDEAFLYKLNYNNGTFFSRTANNIASDKLKFLNYYKGFTLDNYQWWPDVNSRVEKLLKEEQVKNNITAAQIDTSGENKFLKKGMSSFFTAWLRFQ
jgi:hypothetical protein